MHNKACEMNLEGGKWGTWGVEKSWLMVGNKCDWLYDEVNLYFPPTLPHPSHFQISAPLCWPQHPHKCLKLLSFFFFLTLISQKDVWLSPIAALQIKCSSPCAADRHRDAQLYLFLLAPNQRCSRYTPKSKHKWKAHSQKNCLTERRNYWCSFFGIKSWDLLLKTEKMSSENETSH